MSEDKAQFKPVKRKNIRQRKQSSDVEGAEKEEESAIRAKSELIHETKEKQKLRNRSNGVNVASLALGKKITLEEEVSKDPFNVKSGGGMVNMQALKAGKLKSASDDGEFEQKLKNIVLIVVFMKFSIRHWNRNAILG